MSKKVDEEVVLTTNNNQNTLYGIIIVLLLIIAVWGFFLWMKLWSGWQTVTNPVNTWTVWGSGIAEDIIVTVYDDSRCSDCQTDAIVDSLKQLPVLASAEFIVKDFSEAGVEQFLIDNSENIDLLPAAVFSTNSVWPTLAESLLKLPDGSYFLRLADGNQVPGFDPFEKRSENGFKIVEESILTELQSNAYFKWDENATITWIEYTDVNCGFCKKMETDGTAVAVMAEFPTELNKATSNYVGVGWAATQTAAEIFECAGSLAWADVYNSMISDTLVSWDNSADTLLALWAESGVDATALQSCYDNGDTKDLVAEKFAMWAENFWISGTPGNVLINNETWEFTIVSWAYPASEFITQINGLLWNN